MEDLNNLKLVSGIINALREMYDGCVTNVSSVDNNFEIHIEVPTIYCKSVIYKHNFYYDCNINKDYTTIRDSVIDKIFNDVDIELGIVKRDYFHDIGIKITNMYSVVISAQKISSICLIETPSTKGVSAYVEISDCREGKECKRDYIINLYHISLFYKSEINILLERILALTYRDFNA